MVELDLRRTRDGEIVVLHDQMLQRLWGVDASVGDLDLADVRHSVRATSVSRRCARSSGQCPFR